MSERLCLRSDLITVQAGYLISKINDDGFAIAGTGEFVHSDVLFNEVFECSNCLREFDDNLEAALKHILKGQPDENTSDL